MRHGQHGNLTDNFFKKNQVLAAVRLNATTKRLKKISRLQEYNKAIQEQLQEGVIKPILEQATGEVIHYIPDQAVIRDEAETTNLRIVYDYSVKENSQQLSLNNWIETGSSLQPLLFNILMRNQMRYFCIAGDTKKAFLKMCISKQDRDSFRILWYGDLNSREIKEYCFTRAIFGFKPSPYILNGTIKKNVTSYSKIY